MHWSSTHLSLAERVVVANQVLLATMWYITSCWIFLSSCISHRRLIGNFLQSRIDGSPTWAKVAWPVVMLLTEHDGLGIVDLAYHNRALLGKFVVHGLLASPKLWKEFCWD